MFEEGTHLFVDSLVLQQVEYGFDLFSQLFFGHFDFRDNAHQLVEKLFFDLMVDNSVLLCLL